jgi:ATPase subunit of ABC transporter with duplicated ATPase domains
MNDLKKEASILKDRLKIDSDWMWRWDTLSHGERKRLQMAVALWQNPDILAVDEPTNHLDITSRNMILSSLQKFQGIGLLVSHDRQLLDLLCHHCLFIEPFSVKMRKGGYSECSKIHRLETESSNKLFHKKKQEINKIHSEIKRRKEKAASADRKKSKRRIDRKDHDSKEKIDRARVTGKDGTAGKLQKQLSGRLSQAETKLKQITFHKEYPTGIWFSDGFAKKDSIAHLKESIIQFGNQRSLSHPALWLGPKDRVGIKGPNGAGKSTLVHILKNKVELPSEKIIYIPQEIDRNQSRCLLDSILELPPAQLGFLMTAIKRLGSEPKHILESELPSPGETRKLLLALGLLQEPHIIIMDEPTNHMDLVSIEALESALKECPCCLVLVSHDHYFLDQLSSTIWEFYLSSPNTDQYQVKVYLQ